MFMTFTASARAEIIGFGNFSQFEINQNDAGAAPVISIANNRILLTNEDSVSQARSIFHKTPQNIAGPFSASYTYQTSADGPATNMGLAFVLQNSPSGFDALGDTWYRLGYGGINNSVALSLELEDGGRSGLYTNGNKGVGGGSLVSPLNLGLGNPVNVEIVYDGVILSQTLTDTVTLASYSADYLIDIPGVIGSSTAYVGFTGSTALDTGRRDQFVSHVSFVNVPEPGSMVIGVTGACGLLALQLVRRRRKNGYATEGQ